MVTEPWTLPSATASAPSLLPRGSSSATPVRSTRFARSVAAASAAVINVQAPHASDIRLRSMSGDRHAIASIAPWTASPPTRVASHGVVRPSMNSALPTPISCAPTRRAVAIRRSVGRAPIVRRKCSGATTYQTPIPVLTAPNTVAKLWAFAIIHLAGVCPGPGDAGRSLGP